MRGLIFSIIISAVAFFGGFHLHQYLSPESYLLRIDLEQPRRTIDSVPKNHFLAPGSIHFSNYKVISQKNMFRPERKEWIPPPKVDKPPPRKPVKAKPKTPPPRLTLYGTIIYGENVRIAIIKGGGKGGSPGRKRNYRLGEYISGYLIKEIGEDKVLLVKEDDKIELKLREGKTLQATQPGRTRQKRQVRKPPPAAVKKGSPGKKASEGPERIVVKGPGGKEIVKRKKVIRTPFGPKTIYIEER